MALQDVIRINALCSPVLPGLLGLLCRQKSPIALEEFPSRHKSVPSISQLFLLSSGFLQACTHLHTVAFPNKKPFGLFLGKQNISCSCMQQIESWNRGINESWNHRIIQQLGLEGTLKIPELQPPAAGWVDEDCQTYRCVFYSRSTTLHFFLFIGFPFSFSWGK